MVESRISLDLVARSTPYPWGMDMTRRELARRCGVNFETVRYYEQRRLLPSPPRSSGNYRLYAEDAVRRIRFIKRAQSLGFKLREVRELLELADAPSTPCQAVLERARAKLSDLDAKLADLRAMRASLGSIVDDCTGIGSVTGCSILDALEDPDD